MSAQMPQMTVDGDSHFYWQGIKQGKLYIQRCDACTRAVFYPRSICPHCHADQLSWIVASGNGTIYAYTVVHQAFGAFAEQVPFIVALVELEEGVRMMTRVVDAPREHVAIGRAVRVTFTAIDDDLTLPYFRLVDE